MKFHFSSMLMISLLRQKQIRVMKDFNFWWSLNSSSKSSESPNTYKVSKWSLWRMGFYFVKASVCEEWDFTLSRPVYSKNCEYFLFPQRKQGLHPNGAPFGFKKVFRIWRWEILSSSVPPTHWKFHIACVSYLLIPRVFILHSMRSVLPWARALS